jgi:hypothetical protein
VSWRPWATPTCGNTERARKHGSRPGYLWREEADDPDNEVDKGEYSRIDAYYDTRIGPRCTMGRAQVLDANLHLGPGPGAGTRVVLKVPPDSQQPKRPVYSTLVGFSRIAF